MIWVVHFIVINLLLVISKIIKKDSIFIIGTFVYSVFTFGQRWMTGTDFPFYLEYYLTDHQNFEFGYRAIQNFLKSNDLYFGLLIFGIYTLTLYNYYRLITKITTENKTRVLLIYFLCFSELYFAQLSQIRNYLAVSFFVNALYWAYYKNKIKAVVNIIFGLAFHKSILFAVPFLFLIRLKFKKITYLILFIFCLVLPLINPTFIFEIFDNLMYSGYVDSVFNQKLSGAHYVKYYFFLVLTIIYIYYLNYPEKDSKLSEKDSKLYLIINSVLVYNIFYGLSMQFAPIFRFANYFKIFEIIFIIYLLDYLKIFTKRFWLNIIIPVLLVLYLLIAITDSYKISYYEFRPLRFTEDKSYDELRHEMDIYKNKN